MRSVYTKLLVAVVSAGSLLVVLESNAQEGELTMSESHRVADAYYAAFQGGDVEQVPMAEDLKFVSPRYVLDSAKAFKGALRGLFAQVKSLSISSQMIDDGTVLTFYDLDLGAPGGPIPMAERLQITDGKLISVDLLFDSALLPQPAN